MSMEEMLRHEGPVSNTVHNLIQTLNEKLDGAARYHIYEEDGRNEGCSSCQELFRRIDEHDREDIDALLDHLKQHLGSQVGQRAA